MNHQSKSEHQTGNERLCNFTVRSSIFSFLNLNVETNGFGFCRSPGDIRASAHAGVSESERG